MRLPAYVAKRGFFFAAWIAFSLVFVQCKEEEKEAPKRLPTVSTLSPISWGQFSVTFRGDVSSEGNDPVSDKGIVYSSSNATPTLADSKVSAGPGTGPFRMEVSSLPQKTLFYFRSYAQNGQGIAYGEVYKISTTYGPLPGIETVSVVASRNDTDTLRLKLKVTAIGGTALTAVGFTITENSTAGNPPGTVILVSATETGEYEGMLTGSFLKQNTTYNVVAFASNLAGFEFGKTLAVRTSGPASVLGNIPRQSLNTITFSGRVTDRASLRVLRKGFIWVESSASAVANITFSTPNVRTINLPDTGDNSFSYSFSPGDSVQVGRYYRIRAFVENARGISYDAFTTRIRFLPLGAQMTLANGAVGRIFYVDPGNNSLRGFIVEENDMDSTSTWGCHSDSITSEPGLNFSGSTGLANQMTTNTNAMAACPEPTAAGRRARTTGITGWDIPSSSAMKIIYDSLVVTNLMTNFDGKYWTSTHDPKYGDSRAFTFNMAAGVPNERRLTSEKKYLRYKVRRVRPI